MIGGHVEHRPLARETLRSRGSPPTRGAIKWRLFLPASPVDIDVCHAWYVHRYLLLRAAQMRLQRGKLRGAAKPASMR